MERATVILCAIATQKMGREPGDIFRALPQRGETKRQHMEAVIEILAKPLGLDLLPQIGIGGRNDADIGGAASGTAHRTIGPVLEEAQKFDLGRRTERINLIQEERALLGFSDEPLL